MDWLYKGEKFTEEQIGNNVAFVYLITDLDAGKYYVGKKMFSFKRMKVTKGKRKRVTMPSDWQSYHGSCQALLDRVALLGVDYFQREILHLCATKGTASYLELREQIDRRALESPDYYNDYIIARINRSHLKLKG